MSDFRAALAPLFEENFSTFGELGASVSVWMRGREIVHLQGGWRDREKTRPWDEQTLVLVYSATKGPAAACVLKCLSDAGLDLQDRVCRLWPEFAAAGKKEITFAELLSHRAGLAALDDPPSVFDYAAVIHALERQAPLWPPATGHGYHPRTSGFLWDEVVRRVTGKNLGEYWREQFAEPLALDFWIGLPSERLGDVAPMHAARVAPADDPFLRAFAEQDSLTNRAFASPSGLFSVASMNTPEARMSSFPAFGGIGTASALAKFYCALACGGEINGVRVMSQDATRLMHTPLSSGFDKVLRLETAFAAGVMQDPLAADGSKLRSTFGPALTAFGQPGAGGSMAFGDPGQGLGFAYVMNQMELGVLPNRKSVRLVRRLYEALLA